METSAEFYRQILGIRAPWSVGEVKFIAEEARVEVRVVLSGSTGLACPECGKASPGYDTKPRKWRHLDTCQYQTWISADVPRVRCREHGVRMVRVGWADSGERFTQLFESFVIDELLICESIEKLRKKLKVGWKVLRRIQQRAVARGLERRCNAGASHLSVDETSFQKRHEYVTVVSDQQRMAVLYVADDRKQQSLGRFFEELSVRERSQIKSIAMDMWKPYIAATAEYVPRAEEKISFDLFHIAQHMGKAVDKVRRAEHSNLLQQSDERLKGTRYLWLRNPEYMSDQAFEAVNRLARMTLKTARAWHLKEFLMTALKTWRARRYVRAAVERWYRWAIRSRLEPVKKVARTVKEHLWGILNAVWHRRTNSPAESINAQIQKLKRNANGYRNREAFKTTILFHLGKLDLYPSLLDSSPT